MKKIEILLLFIFVVTFNSSCNYKYETPNIPVENDLIHVEEKPHEDTNNEVEEWLKDNFIEYVEYNGHIYALGKTDMTWEAAKKNCESYGGYLATITAEEEQFTVEKLVVNSQKEAVWLGGYKNEIWNWVTDEKFTYENWDNGEPNGSNRIMYLQMYSSSKKDGGQYRWDDTYNTGDLYGGITEHDFVCEWNNIESINTKPEKYADIKFEGGTEWKMLFLVFRNNNINYTDANGNLMQDNNVMSNEEIQCIKDLSSHFTNDVYLDSNKQIYPIVDVYIVDTPICKLTESGNGPWMSSEGTYEIIKNMIDINDYDHITAFANLNNIKTSYFGLGGTYFEQYTGYTFINTINKEQWLEYCDTNTSWTPSVVVHEFLHFIESWSKHIDKDISINVHDAEKYGYNDSDDWRGWYRDFMTNNVKDASGNLTGVSYDVWNSPPSLYR